MVLVTSNVESCKHIGFVLLVFVFLFFFVGGGGDCFFHTKYGYLKCTLKNFHSVVPNILLAKSFIII